MTSWCLSKSGMREEIPLVVPILEISGLGIGSPTIVTRSAPYSGCPFPTKHRGEEFLFDSGTEVFFFAGADLDCLMFRFRV